VPIIDIHTHLYPAVVSHDPVSWAQKWHEPYWLSLVRPPHKRSLQAFVTPEQMISDMQQSGIQQSLLLGWYWENPATCIYHNAFMQRIVADYAPYFKAVASWHPQLENPIAYLNKLHAQGFIGIGEVFLDLQGFSIDDGSFQDTLSWCIDHDWSLHAHVTEPVGHDYPGCRRGPLSVYVDLALAYPQLKIVLAHWGGLLPMYEMNSFVQKAFANVYYDTAASLLLYDHRVWKSVLDIVGSKKILFGSDYPLRLQPQQTAPSVLALIQQAQMMVPQDQLTDVFYHNAHRLWPHIFDERGG